LFTGADITSQLKVGRRQQRVVDVEEVPCGEAGERLGEGGDGAAGARS
jgi:hypothetical protein